MNRLSHIMFSFSLFVALYSLIYAFSVWLAGSGLLLLDLLFYYLSGGIILTIIAIPILYYKAPHKDMSNRTTSNRGALGAMSFMTFCLGSLAGAVYYQWSSGIPFIGDISIFIGAVITISGALMPDWDIPFLGIARHRNIIFHSIILPLLIVLMTLVNVAQSIASLYSLRVGAHVEYYVTALFLLGYASHLYLDIFPSDANPLEMVWRAVDITSSAPTGLKPLGPINISKKNARMWLIGNATLLTLIALGLFGLYFYNLILLTP
ncbi:MAG: metal-dependent hydrolase [Candidatus Thorarchaeota archaeon]